MQDNASIRIAIRHILWQKINKWWTPLLVQASLWKMSAKISLEDVIGFLEDIYEESKDMPFDKYEKVDQNLCYRCTAHFEPNFHLEPADPNQ